VLGVGLKAHSSFPLRVSVSLLKMLNQLLANGCFDIFTTEEK
jgi:hypothetical protein